MSSDESFSDDGEEDVDETLDEDEFVVNTSVDGAQLCKTDVIVLAPEQIVDAMNGLIVQARDVINLNPTLCRVLLAHFKFNVEALLDQYYCGGDVKYLFEAAKITMPSTSVTMDADGEKTCQICFDELDSTQSTSMDCGHAFCGECWAGYLEQKVMGEGQAPTILCPMTGCGVLVDDALALQLLPSDEAKKRYSHLISQSFVLHNRWLRWCPATDCDNAVKVTELKQKHVQCACGFEFCFCCGAAWHAPINCERLAKWIQKCSDDSETYRWIEGNTRQCPKCAMNIEKNGGCSHMRCRHCKHEFCWLCKKEWFNHVTAGHGCNRYEGSNKTVEDSQAQSKELLKRYLHYFERYDNHQRNQKSEDELRNNVQEKVANLEENSDIMRLDVQYVTKAVQTLIDSRRALMYSYALAYYLESSNEVEIFMDNQSDLEAATEKLGGYLEYDIDIESHNRKQRLTDLCKYVNDRRQVILAHCQEADERGAWSYFDAPKKENVTLTMWT